MHMQWFEVGPFANTYVVEEYKSCRTDWCGFFKERDLGSFLDFLDTHNLNINCIFSRMPIDHILGLHLLLPRLKPLCIILKRRFSCGKFYSKRVCLGSMLFFRQLACCLTSNQVIKVHDQKYHTPGHAPDVLFSKMKDYCFLVTFCLKKGIENLYKGDVSHYLIASIKSCYLGDEVRISPHGPSTTIGHENPQSIFGKVSMPHNEYKLRIISHNCMPSVIAGWKMASAN